jgi:hypothetical protein
MPARSNALAALVLISGLTLAAPARPDNMNPGATPPTTSTTTRIGNVRGVVRDAVSGAVCPLANVTVISAPQLSTLTDDHGVFYLTDVPSGPQTLRVQAFGFTVVQEPVTIPEGGTAQIDIPLGADPDAKHQIDVPLPDRFTLARLADVDDVHLYRLGAIATSADSTHGAPAERFGRWLVLGEVPLPSAKWGRDVAVRLSRDETYLHGSTEESQCIPTPGVGLRFRSGRVTTDVEISTRCGVVFFQSKDRHDSSGLLSGKGHLVLDLLAQAAVSDSAATAAK